MSRNLKSHLVTGLARIGLMAMGVLVGLFIVGWVYPRLLPNANEHMRNVDAGLVQYTVGMGDLFYHQPALMQPPDNLNTVLSEHRLVWDEDGFRQPRQQADDYTIIALGDSYTEAANVARPWPDVLAHNLQEPVRNLGFRGYGPVEKEWVMSNYGESMQADVVIIGFFSGNDLSNAASSTWRDSFQLPGTETLTLQQSEIDFSDDSSTWVYPVQAMIDGQPQDIAFLNGYLSNLMAEKDDVLQSLGLEITLDSWRDIRRTAQAANPQVCVIVAYFPTKGEVYLPLITPDGQERIINSYLTRPILPTPGAAMQSEQANDIIWREMMAKRNNVNQVMAHATREAGFIYLDLLPAFEAAARDTMLYYTYDTHWNQAGHDLTARTIADFIRQGGCDNNKPVR